MSNWRVLWVASVSLALLMPAPATANELGERWKIVRRVQKLVRARDYAGLSALARRYRVTRARTPSGTWKLAIFHGSIRAALPTPEPERHCAFAAGKFLKRWRRATPHSPAPYVATGTLLLDRAWCYRGTKLAADTPPSVWPAYRRNVRQAFVLLSRHRKTASRDPEFYAVMEDIFRAQPRDKEQARKLLREASRRYPYYYGIYTHAYYDAMPQWGGSLELMDEIGRYAVERTRERDGVSAYARYYLSASVKGCECWKQSIDWAFMKDSMLDLGKRWPNPWLYANFARVSCEMKDAETARYWFEELGEGPDSEVWSSSKANRQACRTFAGY